MLRLTLLIAGSLLLFAALLLGTRPEGVGLAADCGLYGLLLVGGILFERHQYRPKVDRRRGIWEPTGERFLDPVSGELVEVFANPQTGERDYVPVDR